MAAKIHAFFQSLKDVEAAKRLIAPDAVFIAARAKSYPDLPVYGTYRGHEGFSRFVAQLRESFDTKLFQIDHALENEETGFASGRFSHRVRKTGDMFDSHWAVLFKFKDGLVAHYRFYEDTAALEEAFAVRTRSCEDVAG